MKDRYVGVDDPRPGPGAPPAQSPEPAAGIEEPQPAAETPKAGQENPAHLEDEVRRPEDEIDRSVRVTREVLLGRPGPHSLEAAAVEIERRLRDGAGR